MTPPTKKNKLKKRGESNVPVLVTGMCRRCVCTVVYITCGCVWERDVSAQLVQRECLQIHLCSMAAVTCLLCQILPFPPHIPLLHPPRLAPSSAQKGAGLSLILHAAAVHHHPQLSSATQLFSLTFQIRLLSSSTSLCLSVPLHFAFPQLCYLNILGPKACGVSAWPCCGAQKDRKKNTPIQSDSILTFLTSLRGLVGSGVDSGLKSGLRLRLVMQQNGLSVASQCVYWDGSYNAGQAANAVFTSMLQGATVKQKSP